MIDSTIGVMTAGSSEFTEGSSCEAVDCYAFRGRSGSIGLSVENQHNLTVLGIGDEKCVGEWIAIQPDSFIPLKAIRTIAVVSGAQSS